MKELTRKEWVRKFIDARFAGTTKATSLDKFKAEINKKGE